MNRASHPSANPTRDDRFPPGIPFIVGNEGAERFSYYGMRQILYVYLTSLFLGFMAEQAVGTQALADAKVRATQVTHLFMAGVYLFPMIGGILADRFLGKYRVILMVSFIYCAGHAALAIAGRAGSTGSLGFAETAMFAGLALVALGSGGIKPCVSANVGDQFTEKNSHLITRVFQIFYFIINFGSFFASLLTPYLFKRFGAEVAFGVPGVLMAIATLIFWLGRKRYVRLPPKPGGALGGLDFMASSLLAVPLLVVVGVGTGVAEEIVEAAMSQRDGAVGASIAHVIATHWGYAAAGAIAFLMGLGLFAIRQRKAEDSGFLSVLLYSFRNRERRQPGEDFWAPARRHFGEEAAEGPPAVLRIIVVFSMVSVFWALFDQHSSTWVEQAKAMNLVLQVPASLWSGWLIPATVAGALFGGAWLFLWISNRPPSARITRGVLVLIGIWGLGALGHQLWRGSTQRVELLPAQLAALNPLFVMIIIPLLNVLVYQPLERRGRPLKPLHRMGIGMVLTAVAFASVALLQARIEGAGKGEVHVLWQVIPYFLITTAEVLVSVTGLEFAYTQAPRAMKAIIASFWLLCVTFGNVLVAFLAPLQKMSLSTFFWVFAGLMALAAGIFLVLAARYRGKSYLQPAASSKS
ncbi:MAG: MFS transporter [Verrucomicrobiales bacterium]|nr:MFS transporter [Verrucomicrobiales bacterium]